MAYTIENNYTGNGSTRLYSFTFPYLETTDIKVSLNGVDQTLTTHYTLASPTQISFVSAPGTDVAIRIYRDTDISALQSEFFSGSAIRAQDLNNDFNQTLYVSQETEKAVEGKWNNTTETLASTESFVDSNDYIMTAAAIDDRINTNIASHSLTDGKIWVGNGSNVAVQRTPTGDVTINNTGGFNITAAAVEHGMLANDIIDGTNIQDDAINSEHYVDGSIDLAHLASNSVNSSKIVDGTIVDGDIASNTITGGKLASGTITHTQLATNAVTTGKIIADAVTAAKIADGTIVDGLIADTTITGGKLASATITHTQLAANAVTTGKVTADAITSALIADDQIDSEHYVDGSIDHAHLSNDCIDGDNIQDDAVAAEHIASNAVVNDSISASAAIAHSKLAAVPDGQIIVGNGSTVPTAVAVSGDVTIANTGAVTIANDAVEIGMIGCEQTTISDSDSHIPTSGAVVDYVASIINPIGGLEVIADDESFPNTIPATGVVISISDAAGLQINSSGVSTNGDTLDNSTVTINGFPSELRGGVSGNADPYVLAAGTGLMVQSTGSSHTYNYHQVMIREADFVQLSDDISDFNSRYRIGTKTADNHSSNDDGDLFFDTGANKMYVYDGAYNSGGSWKEVTSAGDFKILTVKDHDQAAGGSGPTFNGSNEEFDLFDSSSDASINSAAQLLVVLNGVIQKPNSGTFSGSEEGFYLNDTHGIKFCDPPPSGSVLFVTQIGSAVSLNEPADDSVSAAKIQTGAVSHAKLAADCVDGDNIQDDVINSEHIAAGAIDNEHIADDQIDSEHYAAGSIDLEHMSSQSVDEDNLYIDNAGSNGQFLQKQSGGTGGLLWADASVGGDTGTDYNDNVKVRFGTGNDLEVFHSGSAATIKNTEGNLNITNTGSNTIINADNITFQSGDQGETIARFIDDGVCELWHNNVKTFATTSSGIDVWGPEGGDGNVHIYADEGDDNADCWKLKADTNGGFSIQNYTAGSWENNLTAIGNGAIDLYYDNSKKMSTFSAGIQLENDSALTMNSDSSSIYFGADDDLRIYHNGSNALISNATGAYDISTGGTRRVYIASGGHITFQKDAIDIGTVGQTFTNSGELWLTRDNGIPFSINRKSSDGQLVRYHQDGTHEGNVSVSGSTVSYNGGHLSRWSQFKGISQTDKSARPTIYQGTVLSNLDDLCQWEGETNQQLNMTKVSDTSGDKDVAGVFWTWDDDPDDTVTNENDFYVAMTGDMVIRVAGSTTVARGDLLISAGDGTAKPQADDIIRSSTIAKIISTNSTATYADGSKAYPCVLMAC